MWWRPGVRPLVLGLALALLGCSVVDPRVKERWATIRTAPPSRDGSAVPDIPPVLPVVFVPGSKGSVLKRPDCNGTILWGSTKAVWLWHLDDLIVPLPKENGSAEDRFDQNIQPCGIVSDFEVRLFVPFRVTFEYPIYRDLTTVLKEAGAFKLDENIFYFSYDWRLDTRIAALELAAKLDEYRAQYYATYLKEYCRALQLPDPQACLEVVHGKWGHIVTVREVGGTLRYDIKFNIVTHSLGGIVTQYLIRGLGYGEEVDNLVMIASPSDGAMFALKIVVAGELAFPDTLIHFYEEKETRPIGFSLPSAFQGFPRYLRPLKLEPGLQRPQPAPAWAVEWDPEWHL